MTSRRGTSLAKNIPETAELALCSLTHDVGKFMERANPHREGLSAVSLGLESSICPVYNSRYSHAHVLYTNEFFEWTEKNGLLWPAGMDQRRIANLACYHHRPATV